MVAQFPTQVRVFSNKKDLANTVMADHVNALQEEVTAIEDTLTIAILTSTYTGSFVDTTDWSTLQQRLVNIERGLVNGVPNSPYVRTAGGSVLANSSGSAGLSLSTSTGVYNLVSAFAYENIPGFNAGALTFNLNYNGIPKVGTGNVLYVGGMDYNALLALIAAAQNTADSATISGAIHPFVLSGM